MLKKYRKYIILHYNLNHCASYANIIFQNMKNIVLKLDPNNFVNTTFKYSATI